MTKQECEKIINNLNYIRSHIPKSWNNTLRMIKEIERTVRIELRNLSLKEDMSPKEDKNKA